jgi:hypothetical protein
MTLEPEKALEALDFHPWYDRSTMTCSGGNEWCGEHVLKSISTNPGPSWAARGYEGLTRFLLLLVFYVMRTIAIPLFPGRRLGVRIIQEEDGVVAQWTFLRKAPKHS